MTKDEIIEMATQAGFEHIAEANYWHPLFAKFAKLVEEHVRNAINEEAKAHLEELRKNFNAESAELRLHMWSKEKQAPAPYESSIGHMFGDKR